MLKTLYICKLGPFLTYFPMIFSAIKNDGKPIWSYICDLLANLQRRCVNYQAGFKHLKVTISKEKGGYGRLRVCVRIVLISI